MSRKNEITKFQFVKVNKYKDKLEVRRLILITVAVVAMVINHAELRNVVLNMERLNIAMNADNIHAKNINT